MAVATATPEAPPAPVAEGTPPIEEVEWAESPKLTPKAPAVPPSEAPSTEAQVPPSDAEDPAPKTADGTKAELPTDWKAKLAANDPEFMAEFENDVHVKGWIDGRLGFIRRQEQLAAQAAAAEAERKQLRDTDPKAFAEADRKAEQQSTEAAGVQNLVRAQMDDSIAPVADWITKDYPEDVQKAYNAAVNAGQGTTLAAFVKNTHQALLSYELAKAKDEWLKTELPAAVKHHLAKMSGSEPSLDLGTGTPANSSGLTLESIKQLSPTQFRKLTGTPAGRAQYDAYFNAGIA